MSIEGSSSIRRFKDVAVVVHLHEFAPVGRRASSGRDGWRFERLAEVRENLTNGSRLSDERGEPDVTSRWPSPMARSCLIRRMANSFQSEAKCRSRVL